MQDYHTDACFALSIPEILNAFASYDFCLIIVGLRQLKADIMKVLHIIPQIKAYPILAISPKLTEEQKVTLLCAGANAVLERPLDISLCVAQANSLIQLFEEQEKKRCSVH